jgi:hypothetical protein
MGNYNIVDFPYIPYSIFLSIIFYYSFPTLLDVELLLALVNLMPKKLSELNELSLLCELINKLFESPSLS